MGDIADPAVREAIRQALADVDTANRIVQAGGASPRVPTAGPLAVRKSDSIAVSQDLAVGQGLGRRHRVSRPFPSTRARRPYSRQVIRNLVGEGVRRSDLESFTEDILRHITMAGIPDDQRLTAADVVEMLAVRTEADGARHFEQTGVYVPIVHRNDGLTAMGATVLSHAEKLLHEAILWDSFDQPGGAEMRAAPEGIGVSRMQCVDCRTWFQSRAVSENRVLVVASPTSGADIAHVTVRVFMPATEDSPRGQVIELPFRRFPAPATGAQRRARPGGIAPDAPTRPADEGGNDARQADEPSRWEDRLDDELWLLETRLPKAIEVLHRMAERVTQARDAGDAARTARVEQRAFIVFEQVDRLVSTAELWLPRAARLPALAPRTSAGQELLRETKSADRALWGLLRELWRQGLEQPSDLSARQAAERMELARQQRDDPSTSTPQQWLDLNERHQREWADLSTTMTGELAAYFEAMRDGPPQVRRVAYETVVDVVARDGSPTGQQIANMVHYLVVRRPGGRLARPTTEISVRLRLSEAYAEPADVERVRQQIERAVDHFFNAPLHMLPDGSVLRVDVRFDDRPLTSTDLRLRVGPGRGRASADQVYVQSHIATLAHELGHLLGLDDEYLDPHVLTIDRMTAESPGVHRDGSLMASTSHPDGTPRTDASLKVRHMRTLFDSIQAWSEPVDEDEADKAPHGVIRYPVAKPLPVASPEAVAARLDAVRADMQRLIDAQMADTPESPLQVMEAIRERGKALDVAVERLAAAWEDGQLTTGELEALNLDAESALAGLQRAAADARRIVRDLYRVSFAAHEAVAMAEDLPPDQRPASLTVVVGMDMRPMIERLRRLLGQADQAIARAEVQNVYGKEPDAAGPDDAPAQPEAPAESPGWEPANAPARPRQVEHHLTEVEVDGRQVPVLVERTLSRSTVMPPRERVLDLSQFPPQELSPAVLGPGEVFHAKPALASPEEIEQARRELRSANLRVRNEVTSLPLSEHAWFRSMPGMESRRAANQQRLEEALEARSKALERLAELKAPDAGRGLDPAALERLLRPQLYPGLPDDILPDLLPPAFAVLRMLGGNQVTSPQWEQAQVEFLRKFFDPATSIELNHWNDQPSVDRNGRPFKKGPPIELGGFLKRLPVGDPLLVGDMQTAQPHGGVLAEPSEQVSGWPRVAHMRTSDGWTGWFAIVDNLREERTITNVTQPLAFNVFLGTADAPIAALRPFRLQYNDKTTHEFTHQGALVVLGGIVTDPEGKTRTVGPAYVPPRPEDVVFRRSHTVGVQFSWGVEAPLGPFHTLSFGGKHTIRQDAETGEFFWQNLIGGNFFDQDIPIAADSTLFPFDTPPILVHGVPVVFEIDPTKSTKEAAGFWFEPFRDPNGFPTGKRVPIDLSKWPMNMPGMRSLLERLVTRPVPEPSELLPAPAPVAPDPVTIAVRQDPGAGVTIQRTVPGIGVMGTVVQRPVSTAQVRVGADGSLSIEPVPSTSPVVGPGAPVAPGTQPIGGERAAIGSDGIAVVPVAGRRVTVRLGADQTLDVREVPEASPALREAARALEAALLAVSAIPPEADWHALERAESELADAINAVASQPEVRDTLIPEPVARVREADRVLDDVGYRADRQRLEQELGRAVPALERARQALEVHASEVEVLSGKLEEALRRYGHAVEHPTRYARQEVPAWQRTVAEARTRLDQALSGTDGLVRGLRDAHQSLTAAVDEATDLPAAYRPPAAETVEVPDLAEVAGRVDPPLVAANELSGRASERQRALDEQARTMPAGPLTQENPALVHAGLELGGAVRKAQAAAADAPLERLQDLREAVVSSRDRVTALRIENGAARTAQPYQALPGARDLVAGASRTVRALDASIAQAEARQTVLGGLPALDGPFLAMNKAMDAFVTAARQPVPPADLPRLRAEASTAVDAMAEALRPVLHLPAGFEAVAAGAMPADAAGLAVASVVDKRAALESSRELLRLLDAGPEPGSGPAPEPPPAPPPPASGGPAPSLRTTPQAAREPRAPTLEDLQPPFQTMNDSVAAFVAASRQTELPLVDLEARRAQARAAVGTMRDALHGAPRGGDCTGAAVAAIQATVHLSELLIG